MHEKIEYIVQKGYISNTFIQTPKILNKNLANKNTSSLQCYYLQLTIKYTVYETRSVYMTYSNKQRHQNIKVNSTSTM